MYEELIRRLREEPLDSNKAALPIMDLCIDAATAIENLSHRLDMAQGERDAVTRHMIELEQDVCRLKSRLAAYEDLVERWKLRSIEEANRIFHRVNALGGIDLMAQYRDIGSIDHFRDLLQAEQDGRLVVLPCKVGDKVRVDDRTWGNTWNYKTVDGGKYLLGEIVAIIKTRKQTLIKIRAEHNVSWKRPMRRYPISSIGKTVLLTREEAEAALKGGEG